MAAPTVNVTVRLFEQDGSAIAGATVTATLDLTEIYQGFVTPIKATATTDSNGSAVLACFPNAPVPSGLGVVGSTYRFTAKTLAGKKVLDVLAQVPNHACGLDEIAVYEPQPGVSAIKGDKGDKGDPGDSQASATNLAYTASATGGTVTSDTGTDAAIPLADSTTAGLLSPAQHSKLAGIAAGATAVNVDATPTDGSANAVASNGVFDALAGKSDTSHTHTGTYDPAGTAASTVAAHASASDPHGDRAFATAADAAVASAAAADATSKANAAAAASTPAAHAGAGGTAHANAVAGGAAGFMTGADKAKLDGVAAGAQVNPASTDALAEGSTNLYHTAARVRAALLTGLSTATATVVTAAHTVLEAIGFLQKQVSDNTTAIAGKQATLVSATNIKTINGNTLLGSGDLTVSGGGGTPGGSTTQVQFNNAGAFGGDAGLTYDSTNKALSVGGATVTTSAPVVNVTQTWNASGTTFTGKRTNITDTASAAGSLLEDWQIGGVSKLAIVKNGRLRVFTGSESALSISSKDAGWGGMWFNGNFIGTVANDQTQFLVTPYNVVLRNPIPLCWHASGSPTDQNTVDVGIVRNAAGVLEIHNGNAGTFRDLKLRSLIASGGVVTLASFTVSTLPSASTSGAGAMAYATDANATTYRSTVASGGANKVQVTSDGTNWLITG